MHPGQSGQKPNRARREQRKSFRSQIKTGLWLCLFVLSGVHCFVYLATPCFFQQSVDCPCVCVLNRKPEDPRRILHNSCSGVPFCRLCLCTPLFALFSPLLYHSLSSTLSITRWRPVVVGQCSGKYCANEQRHACRARVQSSSVGLFLSFEKTEKVRRVLSG
jgi:hypothetical protein